jgi:hypothetical protein
MSGDSSFHWKEICMQAMEETDPQKLHWLLREAEQAIFLRREELRTSAEAREELGTIAVVAEALRAIRVHQLGGVRAER